MSRSTTSPESSSRTRRAGRVAVAGLAVSAAAIGLVPSVAQAAPAAQSAPAAVTTAVKAQTLGQQAAAARTAANKAKKVAADRAKLAAKAKAHYLSLVAKRNALAKRVNASSGPARTQALAEVRYVTGLADNARAAYVHVEQASQRAASAASNFEHQARVLEAQVRNARALAANKTYWPVAISGIPGSTHDISVPVGTPVYAIRDGVVVTSMDLVGYEPRIGVQNGYYSYGRVIKISHPGTPGTMTYAHLSKRMVTSGQHVKAGQLIGLSGETGHAFGPHLHIDFNGVENAIPWLVGAHAVNRPAGL